MLSEQSSFIPQWGRIDLPGFIIEDERSNKG